MQFTSRRVVPRWLSSLAHLEVICCGPESVVILERRRAVVVGHRSGGAILIDILHVVGHLDCGRPGVLRHLGCRGGHLQESRGSTLQHSDGSRRRGGRHKCIVPLEGARCAEGLAQQLILLAQELQRRQLVGGSCSNAYAWASTCRRAVGDLSLGSLG